MKLIAVTVALFGLALSACGSGSYSCSSACNKIYDQCGLALQDQNGPVDKAGCNSLCNSRPGAERDRALTCIKAAACTEQAIFACVQ
jgi:hypothetical protein